MTTNVYNTRPRLKPLTDAQRESRLPKGPWFINVFRYEGDTNYQVQAPSGEVIGDFRDGDYDGPGLARALAESLCHWRGAP